MVKIENLYDLTHTRGENYLKKFTYPWDALPGIGAMIEELGKTLPADEFLQIRDRIWVHRTAIVAPTAYIGAPCIIGANTEIRHGAFIRGNALVGDECVVGNSTKMSFCLMAFRCLITIMWEIVSWAIKLIWELALSLPM